MAQGKRVFCFRRALRLSGREFFLCIASNAPRPVGMPPGKLLQDRNFQVREALLSHVCLSHQHERSETSGEAKPQV